MIAKNNFEISKLKLTREARAGGIVENNYVDHEAKNAYASSNQYRGGKNSGGAYQKIICQIPPHDVFVEPFGGSGSITKRIKLAKSNFIIEKDVMQASKLKITMPPGAIVINGCGISFLSKLFDGGSLGKVCIYADPPYPVSSILAGRPIYKYSLTDEDHCRLLELLMAMPADIVVSSYHNEIYDTMLKDWRQVEFPLRTRRGWATEVLYMNFPDPIALHDYSYVGENAMRRQMFKRKQQRWADRLAKMDILERQALMKCLMDLK